jgi:hypothetical protein
MNRANIRRPLQPAVKNALLRRRRRETGRHLRKLLSPKWANNPEDWARIPARRSPPADLTP